MPNVSKHPADAGKSDPQEQLKKLRESLLREGEARADSGGDKALSKKEGRCTAVCGGEGCDTSCV